MIESIGNIRGKARKGLVILLSLALLGVGGGYGYYRYEHNHEGETSGEEKALYTCGMHPWIISDKPGDCPICGMTLTKLEGASAQDAAKVGAAAVNPKEDDFFSDMGGQSSGGSKKLLFYRNPMDPSITSPVPAKDEMGMDYIAVYEEEAAGGVGVGDRAEVRLQEDAIRRTGVRTAIAVEGELGRPVRTVGRVVPDETRVKVVNAKIGGWIEKLAVNYTGQLVAKGQPLVTLYSPELLATQEEYLRARSSAKRLLNSSDASVRGNAEELMNMAARRLELFDVPKSAITALENTGVATRTVTLRAPSSGYVTGKEVFEGSRIEPGMPLFTITDLSRVWVEADIYEYEAMKIKVGSEAEITLPFSPETQLAGKVTFIYPVVDPEARTIKARFEFQNKDLLLKPGMFADVSMTLEKTSGVVVPDGAVMDTGERKLVYVEKEPGLFEPRIVTVAVRGEGKAVLTSGVAPGENVVTAANFLLDSESRLRSTITKLTAKAKEEAAAKAAGGTK